MAAAQTKTRNTAASISAAALCCIAAGNSPGSGIGLERQESDYHSNLEQKEFFYREFVSSQSDIEHRHRNCNLFILCTRIWSIFSYRGASKLRIFKLGGFRFAKPSAAVLSAHFGPNTIYGIVYDYDEQLLYKPVTLRLCNIEVKLNLKNSAEINISAYSRPRTGENGKECDFPFAA